MINAEVFLERIQVHDSNDQQTLWTLRKGSQGRVTVTRVFLKLKAKEETWAVWLQGWALQLTSHTSLMALNAEKKQIRWVKLQFNVCHALSRDRLAWAKFVAILIRWNIFNYALSVVSLFHSPSFCVLWYCLLLSTLLNRDKSNSPRFKCSLNTSLWSLQIDLQNQF